MHFAISTDAMRYLLLLLLLSGCASFYITEGEYGPSCENKTSLIPEGPYYTYDECLRSPEFQTARERNDERRRLEWESADVAAENTRLASVNAYFKKHPEHKKFKSFTIQKSVVVGMPEEVLVLSWGNPNKVNRTITAGKESKQYIYGTFSRFEKPKFVYLTNGTVTAIQTMD